MQIVGFLFMSQNINGFPSASFLLSSDVQEKYFWGGWVSHLPPLHVGNLSAVDIVEFWVFVVVCIFFLSPCLENSLGSKALELQECA